MNVRVVDTPPDTVALLAGAQFADAFAVEIEGRVPDAHNAAQRMMGRSPRWVEEPFRHRDVAVPPLGLKGAGTGGTAPAGDDTGASGTGCGVVVRALPANPTYSAPPACAQAIWPSARNATRCVSGSRAERSLDRYISPSP